METVNDWKDMLFSSIANMSTKVADMLPNIFGALFILLFGWLITKFIIYVLNKIMRVAKIDQLTDKINDTKFFGDLDFKFKLSKIILGFVKFIMFLIFLIIASDIMKWSVVSNEIGNLLRYLPKLFSAIALFMIGIYIANFVRKAISGVFESFDLSGSKAISGLVFYIIAIIITITSLNQAGIDTSIITNNVTIILGAFLLAFALAFGFGSKEIIQNLLYSFYSRKNYEIGQVLKIRDIEGEITSINNICMTLKTKTGKIVIPIKEVAESEVEIKD
ncbi:mechanosensitive ion channel family protein [Xanthomarina spongicola]|uniref:Mechanosensitive ion channel-like protein n=1 Tax=Xanthomarina spongicola TaxID=570520 RepID=A0A316DMC4_9FLAO|nr:mechanosensitive ion channel domain-containing protein [Xanthomarina spongicola]PWK19055.1 mechanosensitive ion channel-like protein [Xanthomarina spongicola]